MKLFFKKYVPLSFIISAPIALISYFVLRLCEGDADFADLISGSIGMLVRRGMAYITNPIAISVAECFVIFLVLSAVVLIALSLFVLRSARVRVRIILHILAFVFVMYSWYSLAFGVSYHTSPINEKMDFDIEEVTEESLESLSLHLALEINSLSSEISHSGGQSHMDSDLSELSEKILSSYDAFLLDYPMFGNFTSRVKPVMLSELMAYAGILGMYTYFSGEANISYVYPDYCIPSAVIHEFAHQRGIAREDEANFIAYTVATYSDDAYIRYSGYLNLFEYVTSALSKTNPERTREIYSMLDGAVLDDMRAYSEFYRAHMDTPLRDISEFFNDTYLRANGTMGVVSYGMVVRLSVSYYKSRGIIP